MKEEKGDFVKVHIPFDEDTVKRTGCVGENPWAETTDREDEFILANEPLHDDYSHGDRVQVKTIGGRRTVVGKVGQ